VQQQLASEIVVTLSEQNINQACTMFFAIEYFTLH